jgi:hypothetical protein
MSTSPDRRDRSPAPRPPRVAYTTVSLPETLEVQPFPEPAPDGPHLAAEARTDSETTHGTDQRY